jgi:putative ABC transport system permease protein
MIPDGVRRTFRLPTSSERIARELDDEVRFHVEMRANALIEQGFGREAAYAEALRRFGDVDECRAYCISLEVRHMQRAQVRERLSTVRQDLRFAARQLRKSPAFAFVAALTLAAGIGATTAIFSVLNGVVLRPLPYRDSERIVRVLGVDSKGQPMLSMADPTFDALATMTRSFSALAEYRSQDMAVVINGEAVQARGAMASKRFFDVIGTRPAAGRFFVPEEQQIGAPLAAVISSGLAERVFGGAAKAIGGKLNFGEATGIVVGVLPAGQEFPAETDVYLARELRGRNTSYTAHNWTVIGRVRDGISIEQANQDVSLALRALHRSVGDATWTFDGKLVTLREQTVGKVRPLLLMLFGASGILLLIACANVANLLVARMAGRESELAVRLALGAGRARLAQQLLIEAALLASIGCAGGLLLALGGIRVLLALRPTLVPRVSELGVDTRVMGFAVLVSAGTAIALGLLAAWRGVRGDLRAALAQSQRTQSGGGYRLRGTLVVAQIAMTVVLLVGASLLARSFIRLMTIDTGFHTTGVVSAEVGLQARGAGAPGTVDANLLQQQDELEQRARGFPGVTAAGTSDSPPFSGGSSNGSFLILSGADVKLEPSALEQAFRDKSRVGYASYSAVDAGYFKAMGIPLVTGRMFDDRDHADAPHAALISASLAKSQWPNESAIGKTIEFGNIDGNLTPITVIGIVGDTREEDLTAPPTKIIYVSNRQRSKGSVRYVVMATSSEVPTIAAGRRTFRELHPEAPLRFQTIEDTIARSLATQRFMLLLVGVFALTALLLATVGVYSVISYLVALRGREMSIRVALGARAGDIVTLVIGQGIVLTAIGAIAGGVAAFAATRLLRKLLYEISPTDPIAFAAVITILCVVAVVASYLPARRAARLEPMDVLRGG